MARIVPIQEILIQTIKTLHISLEIFLKRDLWERMLFLGKFFPKFLILPIYMKQLSLQSRES